MGSAEAAASAVDTHRKAVKDCHAVTLSILGVGKSVVDVPEISFADMGQKSFAGRFSGSEGALEGLELMQVAVQSGDVVVSMTYEGLDPSDAQTVTKDTVNNVQDKLGTTDTI